ncbi:MAG TPA: replication initiator [Mycobacterium sp.]|nr:replication initiator [Mycobacterium sp.]
MTGPDEVTENGATAFPADPAAVLRLHAVTETQTRTGICHHPITVTGTTLLVEVGTGRILDRSEPGASAVRCRNRRAAMCPSCSALYRLDAFHLIAAGLRGGKDTPAQVAGHPRLLLTLTAPSFGAVHTGPTSGGLARPCHPGVCGASHLPSDPVIGAAIDPNRYDYIGQVLFNAHAGVLWARFTLLARRELAAAIGLGRAEAARRVRIVFAKVTEFQTRGVVHVHAVVRLDGPGGPADAPPVWATMRLLRTVLRRAARKTRMTVPGSRLSAARTLAWGRQIDITPITATESTEATVARYVAKYATKSTEAAGIDIPPISCRICTGAGVTQSRLCRACGGTGRRSGVRLGHLTEHVNALVETCWRLGGQPAYAGLGLRRWAHQLGFHGHFATKSRSYSTTFAALRAERRVHAINLWRHRLGIDPAVSLDVVGDWHYTGRDLTVTPATPAASDDTGTGHGR